MSDVHAIQDVVAFVGQLITVGAQVAADGKVSLTDLALLYQLLSPAQKAVGELGQALAEAKAIDVAGLEALAPKLIEMCAVAVKTVEALLPKTAA